MGSATGHEGAVVEHQTEHMGPFNVKELNVALDVQSDPVFGRILFCRHQRFKENRWEKTENVLFICLIFFCKFYKTLYTWPS